MTLENKSEGYFSKADEYIKSFSSEKELVKSILRMMKNEGYSEIAKIFFRSIEVSNIRVANLIYKAIILDKLHRANIFLGRVHEGTHQEYLSGMSLPERIELADSFLFKIRFHGEDGLEYLEILNKSINQDPKKALKYSRN